MSTVVAYVVSPGWELNLYLSLHSLALSGTSYDYVKVFAVGGDLRFPSDTSVPIKIETVENKNENYFLENKIYIKAKRKKSNIFRFRHSSFETDKQNIR